MNIQTVKFKDISFISVINPGELEVKYLKNNFGFSQLHLDDYTQKTQIPKIEIYKDYSLLVFDFPYFNSASAQAGRTEKNGNGKSSILKGFGAPAIISSVPLPQFPQAEKKRRISSSQVDFFVGKDYLVVLHDGLLNPINDIFVKCQGKLKSREEFMGQGSVFLAYRIIDVLVDSCFPIINDISSSIDRIDKELEERTSQGTIEDISVTRRNLVVFQTMVKPLAPLFTELESGKYKELNGNMQSFWGNVLDHAQKIWDRLEDSRELIEGISSSHESFLSFRTNEIVKFLTIITSISFPFIIVNNLYSMNISGLPYATHPWIVWVLFSVIFLAGLGIILYFKIRRWI